MAAAELYQPRPVVPTALPRERGPEFAREPGLGAGGPIGKMHEHRREAKP